MGDYGRWTTSSSAIGAHWRKKERLQKLETQRRRQRAKEVLAHQANKEYFDSNVLQRPMGLTTTKKGAQREAFAAAYGTEHEGKDTRSDLVNVKAGITTTAEKAAREALSAPVSPHLYVVCASPVVLSTQRGRLWYGARGQGYSFRSGQREGGDHYYEGEGRARGLCGGVRYRTRR